MSFRQALCLAVLGLSACATEPESAPARALPPDFAHRERIAAAWPSRDWYRQFGSNELDALIDQAVKGNADLEVARARVAQADARARQAGAAILPSVDANGTANFLAGHSAQGGGHELDWAGMLSASYEIDFWGKNRASAESARRLATASRASRDTVALTTLAGIADAYFDVLALRQRVSIARQNRDAARKLLGVVEARFNAGSASPVELATQRSAADVAEIALAELERAQTQALTAVSLLLGQLPEGFQVQAQSLDALTEPAVGPGLPSELLTRRPDILLAEANLQSAHADLVVARAAMFPSVSLTASAGVQNPALPATVLTIPGVGPSFALGANLLQPIFDHGRLQAQRDEARAKQTELLVAYRAAIVASFTDVENALSALEHLQRAADFQVENVAQSERAFEGAQARYQAGSGDFLALLEAERTLYAARDQFVQYRLARLQASVGLCKALGGGWTPE